MRNVGREIATLNKKAHGPKLGAPNKFPKWPQRPWKQGNGESG